MTLDQFLQYAGHPGVTFVLGGICGFLGTRFTMTKAERTAHRQRIYENTVRHTQERGKRYAEFVSAIEKFRNKVNNTTPLDLNDFQSVATAGDLYFNELKSAAGAILSKHIDEVERDNTFVPAIAEALEKSIPAYYAALQSISAKVGVPYEGELRRPNYESLYQVLEKYGSLQPMPLASGSNPSTAS